MRRRQLPETWLFTDPRSGDELWRALARLPRGSGVVFRHYELAAPERKALLLRIRSEARRHGLVLVVAGDSYGICVDGIHGRRGDGFVTAGAHNRVELVRARRRGAALVFLSPVYATRSHPSTRPLGRVGFGLLTRAAGVPVAALGGMTTRRYTSLRALGATGWGAIDAWTRK